MDLFEAKIKEIVNSEDRPASYRDLSTFDYEGITYHFEHGTIRNNLSKLRKQGKIEHVCTSTVAYYTIPGSKVGRNAMTRYRTEGTRFGNHPYYTYNQQRFQGYLDSIPMGYRGIHDTRLKFTAKGLWEILPMYSDAEYFVENMEVIGNRSIVLFDMDFGDHIIKTTVHKNDIIEVMVACSRDPIPMNLLGLADLNGSLVSLKERLQRVVDEYIKTTLKSEKLSSDVLVTKEPIPNPIDWIVTMWHFGHDSRYGYSGEMFKMTWKDSLGVFHQVYSKEFKNQKKVKIRKEIQEHPNKPLGQAFMDKLENEINSNENKDPTTNRSYYQ